MRLERNETLVGMSILSASVTSAAGGKGGGGGSATPTVLLVTAQGLGKRLPAEVFKLQHRAGVGNIAIKCNAGDRLMALHVVCACLSVHLCTCVSVCPYVCVGFCVSFLSAPPCCHVAVASSELACSCSWHVLSPLMLLACILGIPQQAMYAMVLPWPTP